MITKIKKSITLLYLCFKVALVRRINILQEWGNTVNVACVRYIHAFPVFSIFKCDIQIWNPEVIIRRGTGLLSGYRHLLPKTEAWDWRHPRSSRIGKKKKNHALLTISHKASVNTNTVKAKLHTWKRVFVRDGVITCMQWHKSEASQFLQDIKRQRIQAIKKAAEFKLY